MQFFVSCSRNAVFDCSAGFARSARIARLGARLLRRRSQTIRRVCSFLLTTAGRDPTLQLGHIRDGIWRSPDLGCYSDAVAGIERRWALLLLRCRSEAL